MRKNHLLLNVLFFTLLFVILFHRQCIGLNLLIYESLVVGLLLWSKQLIFKGKFTISITIALMATAIFTVINYSAFSIAMNMILLFLFVGVLIYPNAKMLLTPIAISSVNFFTGQYGFVKAISSSKMKGRSLGQRLARLSIYIIPLIIIVIFLIIYSLSNPVFNELLADLGDLLNVNLFSLFKNLDGLLILTLVIGLLISNYIFIRKRNTQITDFDKKTSENLNFDKAKDQIALNKTMYANEIRAGVFLLIVLNILILILNVIDINWVWLNFEWEGQYLKQFVHEGTYLLILSILISMGLVLFFFRGALNFIGNNKVLKILSFIWIVQNAVLAISVAVRNYWYIDYFSLAYKRIGVFIFLIMVLYGLITVFLKVKNRKSGSYLINRNLYFIIMFLTISSFINWDVVIAKYNFRQAEHSFLHLDYMAGLSDKTLPYLDVPFSELKQINASQEHKFPFVGEYMSPSEFHSIIQQRKIEFIRKWESKRILSWNLAEYRAYQKLISNP